MCQDFLTCSSNSTLEYALSWNSLVFMLMMLPDLDALVFMTSGVSRKSQGGGEGEHLKDLFSYGILTVVS